MNRTVHAELQTTLYWGLGSKRFDHDHKGCLLEYILNMLLFPKELKVSAHHA